MNILIKILKEFSIDFVTIFFSEKFVSFEAPYVTNISLGVCAINFCSVN